MKAFSRIFSFFLAFTLLLGNMTVPASAKAPSATTDETAYINLDYYGNFSGVSIVKGADLNGNSAITDYGRYASVKNMSTLDQPELNDTGVIWQLNQDSPNRFYYEVTPQDQEMDIPWHFDVSYKLNGVPASAEKLAGASGVVTIDVEATPNLGADPYYRDNFLLMAGMIADSGDNYSFSAPGAQFMSFGSMQAAFYMAMPKQDTSFHFEIGSKSFESSGVFMAMVPATLSQMEDISNIKDHKQNLEDAGNAIDAILDDVFDMMGSMRGGMSTAAQGMDELNQARGVIYNDKDALSASVEKVRGSMKRMKASLADFSDVLDSSNLSRTIDTMSSGFDDVVDSMDNMGGDISQIYASIQRMAALIAQLIPESENTATPGTTTSLGTSATPTDTTESQDQIIREIQEETETLRQLLDEVDIDQDTAEIESQVQDLMITLENYSDESGSIDETEQEIINQMIAALINELSGIDRGFSSMLDEGGDMIDGMEKMVRGMDRMSREMDVTLHEAAIVMRDAAEMIDGFDEMVGAIDTMLSDSGDLLNNGMKMTLDGMSQMMRDMIVVLQKTDDLKKNKNIISDVIRDEWHNLDEDLGILDIDVNAQKLSFTSVRNEEPRSLQIILRTQEIEIVEEVVSVSTEVEDIGFWGRVKLVFLSIWNPFVSK